MLLEHREQRIVVAGLRQRFERMRRFGMRWSAIVGAALVAVGCTPAAAQVFRSSAGDLKVETVAKGLDHPWSIAFLPDGRMLVTERPGRMRIVTKDGKLSPPLV